jgi:hypothetical protein
MLRDLEVIYSKVETSVKRQMKIDFVCFFRRVALYSTVCRLMMIETCCGTNIGRGEEELFR